MNNREEGCQFAEQRIDFVNMVLLVLSVVFVAFPLGINMTIPYALKIPVLLLWYFDCIIKGSCYLSKILSTIIICFAIILYEFLYIFIGYSTASIGNFYNTIIYYDIIIKSFYVMIAYNIRAKKIVFRIIQIYLIFVCLINGVYANMMQHFYDEGGLALLLDEIGTAGTPTEFYNMLIFYVAANVYVLFNEKRILLKILDLSAVLASFFFIFSYHTRATSLFLMIFLSLLLLLNRNVKTYSLNNIFSSTIMIGVFLSVIMFVVGDIIVEIIPERVAERLQAMLDLIKGEGDGSDSIYLARFGLNRISINTWLSSAKSTLFGVGNHLGRDHYDLIGQHSFYIDYLAKYGILGTSLVIVSLKSFVKTAKRCASDSSQYFFFIIFFFVYVVLGFFAKSGFAIIALGAFLYSQLALSTIRYCDAIQH